MSRGTQTFSKTEREVEDVRGFRPFVRPLGFVLNGRLSRARSGSLNSPWLVGGVSPTPPATSLLLCCVRPDVILRGWTVDLPATPVVGPTIGISAGHRESLVERIGGPRGEDRGDITGIPRSSCLRGGFRGLRRDLSTVSGHVWTILRYPICQPHGTGAAPCSRKFLEVSRTSGRLPKCP
jgi:hypothetical protein